jgi:hypothetical protein
VITFWIFPRQFLFEIRQGYRPPHVVGKMTGQQFIHQVDGPENPVKNQKENGMIVVPADHHGVDAQKKI